jgi:hypothetical protein
VIADWIVIEHEERRTGLACLICKATREIPLPMKLMDFEDLCFEFFRAHKGCGS